MHIWTVDSFDLDLLDDEKRSELVATILETQPRLYATEEAARAAAQKEMDDLKAEIDGYREDDEPYLAWREAAIDEDDPQREWHTRGPDEGWGGLIVRMTRLEVSE